jgi:N-acetylmuramoyl-L-alanine amidase
MTSFTADYRRAQVHPSPNHGERAGGRKPDMILLHYTGMGTALGALDWLCREESQVSSHYFIHEDGTLMQLVPERRRAWHAGKGSWHDEDDINSLSIGIEIANAGHPGGLPHFPDEQIAAVIELCLDCGDRWSIAPERVLGHSDVAPIRKVDPGERFPWAKLHAAGVGHWVEPAPITGGRFFQNGDTGKPIEAQQSKQSL